MKDAAPAHNEITEPSEPRARELLEQYIAAFENADAATLKRALRHDAALEMVGSRTWFAENGVLVPITGVRDPGNPAVVRVRNGQRRTLAAREAGLATVPVYVLPSTAADASQETIDRIVHQSAAAFHCEMAR